MPTHLDECQVITICDHLGFLLSVAESIGLQRRIEPYNPVGLRWRQYLTCLSLPDSLLSPTQCFNAASSPDPPDRVADRRCESPDSSGSPRAQPYKVLPAREPAHPRTSIGLLRVPLSRGNGGTSAKAVTFLRVNVPSLGRLAKTSS